MAKSNLQVGASAPNRQTRADLTQSNQGLAARVLSDPSIFPDTFTAWIPRWIMQNPNFRLIQSQLPLVGAKHVVGATGEAAAFQNSWVYFGSGSVPSYYVDPFGCIHLNGLVKSGTVSATATGDVFTLPAGFRPQYKHFFAVASNGAFGLCTVDTTGEVRAEAGNNTYFSLDGISFRQFS